MKKEEEELWQSVRESRDINDEIQKIASSTKKQAGLFQRTSSVRSVSSDRHKLRSGKKLKGFEQSK